MLTNSNQDGPGQDHFCSYDGRHAMFINRPIRLSGPLAAVLALGLALLPAVRFGAGTDRV